MFIAMKLREGRRLMVLFEVCLIGLGEHDGWVPPFVGLVAAGGESVLSTVVWVGSPMMVGGPPFPPTRLLEKSSPGLGS